MFTRALAILLLSSCAAFAQGPPVAVGWPTGATPYFRYDDNTTGNFLYGDTWKGFGAYTVGGNRFVTWNDGWLNASSEFTNIMLLRYSAYDLSSRPNGVTLTNTGAADYASFKGAGWNSLTLSSASNCDAGGGTGGCTMKGYTPFSVKGYLIWPVYLQNSGGTTHGDSHGSWIISHNADSGSTLTWLNPAHLPGGTPNINGDPISWNTTTPGADIIFPATDGVVNPMAKMSVILPANYQDDGATCPVIPTSMGGDGVGTYLYFYAVDGIFYKVRLYRLPCANIPDSTGSGWETWTGSAWSATLSSAGTIAYSSPVYASGTGAATWPGTGNALGTSLEPFYLPNLGRIVILGQVCQYCQGSYDPTVQMSQSASIYGPFVTDPVSRWMTPTWQTGTNPMTRKLNGSGIVNSTSTSFTTDYSYRAGEDPPTFPFDVSIGGEAIRICYAAPGGTTWSIGVTAGTSSACEDVAGRGAGASAHASGVEVLAPFRNGMSFPSFVPGTYHWDPTTGTATIDIAGEANTSNGGANSQLKAQTVYSPYFETLTFRAAPNANSGFGNMPLRLRSGVSSKFALPRVGLVAAWDFWQPNYTTAGQMLPRDLISRDIAACTRAAGTNITWDNGTGTYYGGALWSSNGTGADTYCTSPSNAPISGTNAYSVIVIGKPTSVGTHYDTLFYIGDTVSATTTSLQLMVMSTAAAVPKAMWFNTGANNGIRTTIGAWDTNTWSINGATRIAGAGNISTLVNLYVNGAYNCGPAGAVSCGVTTDGAQNIAASKPIIFGANKNSGSFSNWWNGTLGGLYIWNRVLSPTEMHNACLYLKSIYAQPPRSVALTCN